MTQIKAMDYAEKLYPELDENTRMIIAIAYMDGCIYTINEQTENMQNERLLREERDERMRYDALDIQSEMYDEESDDLSEYTREDEAYDRASSNAGELI